MTQAAPTFVRWLWIWITVGALVVVVVIGFLIGIVSALESIDDGLFEADEAVAGARSDTDPLPEYVRDINNNLTSIDKSLKPIRGQAGQILGSLRQIQGSLQDVDDSLVSTSGSLRNTSSSLIDTSNTLGNITSLLVNTAGTLQTISATLTSVSGTLAGVSSSLMQTSGVLRRISPSLVDVSRDLVSVRSLASNIDATLKDAQSRNTLGTNAIWRRVRFLNGGPFIRPGDRNDNDTSLAGPGNNPNGLVPVKVDADNILGGLREVNKHLTSVCEAPVLRVEIPGLVRGPGPC